MDELMRFLLENRRGFSVQFLNPVGPRDKGLAVRVEIPLDNLDLGDLDKLTTFIKHEELIANLDNQARVIVVLISDMEV